MKQSSNRKCKWMKISQKIVRVGHQKIRVTVEKRYNWYEFRGKQ